MIDWYEEVFLILFFFIWRLDVSVGLSSYLMDFMDVEDMNVRNCRLFL